MVCRAPALKALAMDLSRGPRLAIGLLESAGARLQHLELLLARKWPVREPFDGFWQALQACTELAALQLLVQRGYGHAEGQVSVHGGHSNNSNALISPKSRGASISMAVFCNPGSL